MQFETGSGDYTKIRKNVVMGKRVADLYKKSVLFEKKKPRAGVFKDESVSDRNTIHSISLYISHPRMVTLQLSDTENQCQIRKYFSRP